jgi:hypothetical protein
MFRHSPEWTTIVAAGSGRPSADRPSHEPTAVLSRRARSAADARDGMSTRTRLDFDDLMRHLMVVGFAALTAWTLVSAGGLATGMLTISPRATLRFLLAVLIVVFARRTYWEVREWRWRRLPPDERFGFVSPLAARPTSWEGAEVPWAEGEDDPTRR